MIRICFPRWGYEENGINSDMARAIASMLGQDIIVEDMLSDCYCGPNDPYYDGSDSWGRIFYNKATCPPNMQEITDRARAAHAPYSPEGEPLPIEDFELIVRRRD